MTPAQRTTLAKLQAEGRLQQVPVDPSVCRTLLAQAHNHLRTAQSGVSLDDPEGAFQIAYSACRKTALSLVLATGLRPIGEAEHATTFAAAAVIAESFGAREIADDAADLRLIRHGSEYRAEVVTVEDAEDAIRIGQELLAAFEPAIERIRRRTT